MDDPAAISVVTLGVRDVAEATRFYQALGFPLSPASVPGQVSFFRTAGAILALWGAADLRRDALAGEGPEPSYRGVALAMNVASPAAVDAALRRAETAGGRVARLPEATDWGGYNGYFADPDSHLWEVAHNPHWPLDERGLPVLP